MPLKLVPPRSGKSPNYSVRGTYLGVYVDQSTGTPVKAQATRFLSHWKEKIERGAFHKRGEKTFLDAAVDYMAAHDDHRFLEKLIEHFGEKPIRGLSQDDINEAAIKLYPKATPATRNRQVYTPVSAILRGAGVELNLRRPKGWRGENRTDWYSTENAFKLFDAADGIDPEFGLYLRYICYTGLRLKESLTLKTDKLELDRGFCYVGKTKNGEPRGIHLPPHLIEAFRRHPRGLDRPGQYVFRFRKNGRIYELINRAKKACGLEGHPGKFHIFRHTFGTWMTVHGGLDAEGLVKTGVWRDEASARRYRHTVTSEAAQRSDLLPVEKKRETA